MLLASSAFAAPLADDPQPSTTVKFTDAELHSAAGARELALRLRVAADKVCGADEDQRVRETNAFLRCREATIDYAIRNVDSPFLAEALGRTPQVLARISR